jgi:hypothetical protein
MTFCLCRANITNTTVVQTDPRLTYTGTWGNNTSPIFYGGKSTFTNSASSVSLTFEGQRALLNTPVICVANGQIKRLNNLCVGRYER